MKLGNCEVWIACDGEPLPEYAVTVEGDDGKQTSCFVPSEAGKKFAIHFRNNCRKDILRFGKRLDGIRYGVTSVKPGCTRNYWGVRITPTSRRPYQFSHLMTTDDDSSLGHDEHPGLGTIHIQVYRIKRVPISGQAVDPCYTAPKTAGPVHERSKKVGVHCVSLGEEIQVEPVGVSRYNESVIDPTEGPVATFIFRYRPLAILQAQGIAPRPDPGSQCGESEAGPSQQTSESDRNEGRLPEQEERPAKRARLDAKAKADPGDVKPDIVNVESDDNSDDDELNELKVLNRPAAAHSEQD
ncbi:hypothetical protein L227DRAFT_68849 [Lentinus tigrinus ALCF2SS1-6]|uniref:DUF7918 domain-containing protein n=1 Tax=Lentinus tigrinus ALCF2SS1-6 TaxID=1328759 RepID=A0A5C2SE64_9APHY|nr:hypothetical protein L227DRAFT_68849 [Lentinus tigrinus ALCF2SS1-6]